MDKEKSVDNDAKSELEFQYSPSRWSKRMGAQAVIETHIAFGATASQKARQSIPYEVLRYGKGENQLVDLFGTSLPNNSPILVYVHGGYWQDLDRSLSAYLVEPLFKRGIRVAVVGYDLAPIVSLDKIVDEMQDLDTFLTSWASKTKAQDIWYAGHSAGAYLIGTILKSRADKEPERKNFPIRGMIFISGIYDLVPLVDTYINDGLKLTRQGARERSLRNISLKNVQEMMFVVAVAENDSNEFRRQSQEFHEMLHQETHLTEYVLVTEKDHFDVVEKLNDEQYELTQKIISLISNN